MGAPKQKWTAEEEAALKAGIRKHGASKWRTILKDPEFSGMLCMRSNVDLKDKWRNMSVVMNGWGSRSKGRIAMKKSQKVSKHDDNPSALSTAVADFSDEIINAKPLAMSTDAFKSTTSKRPEAKLEYLVLEAIANLKQPTGSDKVAIAKYIEDQYESPADFKQILSRKLKRMTETGKLMKVKRKYMIAQCPASKGRGSKIILIEGKQKEPLRVDRVDIKHARKSQFDSYLPDTRYMTIEEAAAAAAKAIAEAEKAMAEAEEAARHAESTEADAEAAKAYVEEYKNEMGAKMWAGIVA